MISKAISSLLQLIGFGADDYTKWKVPARPQDLLLDVRFPSRIGTWCWLFHWSYLADNVVVEPRLELCHYVRASSQNMHTPAYLEPRLTGLLSFMLSDEMTTGSVTSSDSHKRAFAQRSHAWNIIQPRFKEAFPEVSIQLCYFPYFSENGYWGVAIDACS